MPYEITKGIIHKAKKVVLYGVEGVGKSTFVSHFPDPLFIDTEGSTANMNVKRYPKPTSWEMLKDEIKEIIRLNPCRTLVIDTADWAERLCMEYVCTSHGKKGVEDFGYGNGWTYGEEEWGRFLNLLQDVIDIANINVVLTAHANIRKFELPNEMGSYDKYELKLGKKTTSKTSPLTKEWADMVLFANFKTYVIAVDKEGKKHKAQGKDRVMYTTHHPCWDAKNRYGLPEELPLDYTTIAHIFDDQQSVPEQKSIEPEPLDELKEVPDDLSTVVNDQNGDISNSFDSVIPKALADLMTANNVTEEEVVKAVAERGYFPADMKIKDYPKDFVDGVLIGAWQQVLSMIMTERNMQF